MVELAKSEFSQKVDENFHAIKRLDPTHSIGRQFDPVLTPEAVEKLSDTDKARLEARAATVAKAAIAAIGEYGSANPHARSVAIAAARMMAGLQPFPAEQALEVVPYAAEDTYQDHVLQIEGPDAVPRVAFMDLSDMAIQGYEVAADMINAQTQQEGDK